MTIIGILFCAFLLAQTLLGWLEDPIVSEVEVEVTLGNAYATTLKCRNPLGCTVEHLYDNADCRAAVDAVSTSTTTTLNNNEELVAFLCSSTLYTDGLLIATPFELNNVVSSATAEVLSGDTFVGLPYSPKVPIGDGPTAVGVAITTLIDVDENSEDIMGLSSQLASGEARCPEMDTSGGGMLPVNVPFVVCYQLRLEPTAVTIKNVRAFTWLNLLDAWGGAYGFVFGLIGTTFFWIDQVSASICCGKKTPTSAVELGGL